MNTAGLLGIDNKLMTKNVIPSEFVFFLLVGVLLLCHVPMFYRCPIS